MVLLSILPCNDELEAHTLTPNATATVTHQDDDAAEGCSPLCLCSCCGQQIVIPSQTCLKITVSIAKTSKKAINPIFVLQEENSGIWQPPKLV